MHVLLSWGFTLTNSMVIVENGPFDERGGEERKGKEREGNSNKKKSTREIYDNILRYEPGQRLPN